MDIGNNGGGAAPAPATIHVVSGFMRSFTSLAMQMLEAGGMECVYDREGKPREGQELQSYASGEYHPNAGGLHEMNEAQCKVFDCAPEIYAGKTIKLLCIYGDLPLPEWRGRYKVMLLTRDPEAIIASYEKFFGRKPGYEENGRVQLPLTPELYHRVMNWTVERLRRRKDVDLSIVLGDALVDRPVSTMAQMREVGWPVDPEKAALIVDPKHRHFGAREFTRANA